MKFHDFSPFYRSNEGIKPKVSGDRLLDNPSVADLQSGASFKFDGSNDVVAIAHSTALEPLLGGFTASCWFKTSMASNVQVPLLDKRQPTYNPGWNFYLGNEDKFVSSIEDSGGSLFDAESLVVSAKDGKWHHAVMTFSRGSTNTVNFYLDGVNVGTKTTANVQGSVTNSSVPLNIGRFEDDSGTVKWMDGEIRQVRLHNRALSADEVRAAYNGQAVGYEHVGASQTHLITGNDSDFSAAGTWTLVDQAGGTSVNYTDGAVVLAGLNSGQYTSGNANYFHTASLSLSKGKKVRIKADISSVTGTWDLRYSPGSHPYVSITTGTGNLDVEWIVPEDYGNYLAFAAPAGTSGVGFTMDNFTVQYVGCVAEYLPTGINSTQWVDTSGNGLHGSTSTATAVNHTIGSLTVESGATIKLQDGAGIDFSATSDATGKTSELLDDYEEGTWTPTLTASGGGLTTSSFGINSATYTKVGNMVTASVYISCVVTAVGTGHGVIGGLPFNTLSGGYTPVSTSHETLFGATGGGYTASGGNTMVFVDAGSTVSKAVSGTGTKYIMLEVTYKTS